MLLQTSWDTAVLRDWAGRTDSTTSAERSQTDLHTISPFGQPQKKPEDRNDLPGCPSSGHSSSRHQVLELFASAWSELNNTVP